MIVCGMIAESTVCYYSRVNNYDGGERKCMYVVRLIKVTGGIEVSKPNFWRD